MKKLISLWSDYLTVEAGLSGKSVRAYTSDLRDFHLFMQDEYPGIPPGRVESEHLVAYLQLLQSVGAKTSTISRRTTSVCLFFSFLDDEDMLSENPLESFERPRIQRELPDILTFDQIESLLNAPGEEDTHFLRDRALLEMLYATGCRVSELKNMKLSMLEMEDRTVTVLGKRSRERNVPFGVRARRHLQTYLDASRPTFAGADDSDYVFLSQKGGPLSRQSIWRIVKKYGKRTGIPREFVYPHILRHSFATHMIQNGADLRSVQTLLGHASISTTEVYTHLDVDHLKDVHKEKHPRKNMGP